MRLAFKDGGSNMFREEPDLLGKIGPADKWVNYGGHRIWHAPEVMPRTYEPDNSPVVEKSYDDGALVLRQPIEPNTGIGKQLVITLGKSDKPVVQVDHILVNHNAWPIELAPWALSVVAPGGRVILPQEPFHGHGEDDKFLPVRPLVLWSFTDMADPRWTWGSKYIQLRSDASCATPQKVGLFNSLGWGAFQDAGGDLFIKFLDTEELIPEDFTDMGSNFEIFTKGDFEELESLGPLELLEPGEEAIHTEQWVLVRKPGLPKHDADLAEEMPAIVEGARKLLAESFG